MFDNSMGATFEIRKNEQLDELGVIRILLGLRHVAVFCSFARELDTYLLQ
jgi:hypothetical protein